MRPMRVTGLVMLVCILAAAISINSFAEVKLPEIINNGMVLQRNKPVTLWGSANPGEAVTLATHTGHPSRDHGTLSYLLFPYLRHR